MSSKNSSVDYCSELYKSLYTYFQFTIMVNKTEIKIIPFEYQGKKHYIITCSLERFLGADKSIGYCTTVREENPEEAKNEIIKKLEEGKLEELFKAH